MKTSIRFLLAAIAITFALPAYASDFTPLIILFFAVVIVVFLIVFVSLYKLTSKKPDRWPKQLSRSLVFSIFWAPFPIDGYESWWPACIALLDFSLIPKAAISVVIVTIVLYFLTRMPAINYEDKNS